MIYLASPYSHPLEEVRLERFHAANRAAAKLMAQGHVVYSAISHTHPIAVDADLPLGWNYWRRVDDFFIRICEKVVVLELDGWKDSKGVRAEIDMARALGKLVEYMEPSI